MKKRLLITGATGMLGATLYNYFKFQYQVYTTSTQPLIPEITQENYKAFDLNESSFSPLTDWAKPDVIIHSGALTKGDYCEKHPEETLRVNGLSTLKFKQAAPEAKLIYISTDAVFPSETHLAKEADCVHPSNIYGKSKELGEFFIRESPDNNQHIIRTTIVGLNLHPKRQAFAEWIIRTLSNKQSINLFTDVVFTPISIWHLAEELNHLINQQNYPKVLHISGSEVISKYTFGFELAKSLGLDTSLINQSKLADVPLVAKRANDQSLDCSLYESTSARKLPNLKETIQSFVNNYQHKT